MASKGSPKGHLQPSTANLLRRLNCLSRFDIDARSQLGRRWSPWPLHARAGDCAECGSRPETKASSIKPPTDHLRVGLSRRRWPCVELHCETRWRFLQALRDVRNLLYTGITRGKGLVVLVGQKKAIAIAVRNASGQRRWSKLDDWLRLGASRATSHTSKAR
jgi:hypothetical protein